MNGQPARSALGKILMFIVHAAMSDKPIKWQQRLAISSGVFDLSQLAEMIPTSKHGKESAEGIYLRMDDEDWLGQRAKLVRWQFVQSIVEHWSRKAIESNRVVYGT